MFFLEFSCFFCDPADVGNLISGSSAFPKSNLNIWKFSIYILLKPSLETFEHYYGSLWNEFNCAVVWSFFGTGMKIDLSQSCGHCWVFQICWHIECSTFTASSFRISNSSDGILSLCFVHSDVPKVHLTWQSWMSGSRWVITPLCFFGSLRSFLYSSVYSCHLFLISSVSSLNYWRWSWFTKCWYQSQDSKQFLFLMLKSIFFWENHSLCGELSHTNSPWLMNSLFTSVINFLKIHFYHPLLQFWSCLIHHYNFEFNLDIFIVFIYKHFHNYITYFPNFYFLFSLVLCYYMWTAILFVHFLLSFI